MTSPAAPSRPSLTNATPQEVAARIRAVRRIMLATHSKPDGDAIGSVLALSRACRAADLQPTVYLKGPISGAMRSFVGPDSMIELDNSPPEDEFDLIVICDTGARSQLEPLGDWLAARSGKVVILDHHTQVDPLADMRIVETRYAAAAHLVLDVIDAMGIPIKGGPHSIAEALFLGLATDTGWFRFVNATAEVFGVASRLMRAGADKDRIFALSEENAQPTRLALTARALASVEMLAGGRAALMTLTPEDFRTTGGGPEELTGIVNEPMTIGSVLVSILVTSVEENVTKVSLRSKAPVDLGDGMRPGIDVNRLAGQFGGGGHFHAAGARIREPLAAARKRVVDAVLRTLESTQG